MFLYQINIMQNARRAIVGTVLLAFVPLVFSCKSMSQPVNHSGDIPKRIPPEPQVYTKVEFPDFTVETTVYWRPDGSAVAVDLAISRSQSIMKMNYDDLTAELVWISGHRSIARDQHVPVATITSGGYLLATKTMEFVEPRPQSQLQYVIISYHGREARALPSITN